MTWNLGRALFYEQESLLMHFLRQASHAKYHDDAAHRSDEMLENGIVKEIWGLRLNYESATAAFDYASVERFDNDNSIVDRSGDEGQKQRGHDYYATVIAEKVAIHIATSTSRLLTGS